MRTKINTSAIPDELKALPQWVMWRPAERGGKTTKIPVTPRGYAASTTDPRSWSTFDELTGPRIGFVFTANDDYCGIDLDHCRDPQTGTINGKALSIIAALGTYSEVSVSQTGVHCICRAVLGRGRRTDTLEMYDRGRYFCMTGQAITPARIEARQDVIDRLIPEAVAPKSTREREDAHGPAPTVLFGASVEEDADLLAALRRDGTFEGYFSCGGLMYQRPDYSRLLYRCALSIAKYTADLDQIERIVKQTALYRDAEHTRRKWDTPRGSLTWGRQLIEDAAKKAA